LAKHREVVIEAIEGLDGYHCVRMETFGARDRETDDFCRAKVAECDVFVGIVGHLHGSCPEGSGQSYTEREHDAAVAANKPRLMFIAPEDFPLPVNLIEPDEKRQKQRAFRERVSRERIRDSFTSPEDLARRVVQAIRNWEQEHATTPRRPTTDRAATVMPRPPQPYFAHPYPLQANFTGRVRERKMLTKWLTGGQQPVLALIAIGGMGKSALTWAWLQRDVRCRSINMVDLEPDILLAWARWHRLKGNLEPAREHAEEALTIADRCEYRLKQADIHNFLARLALDAGDREAARRHAEIARERAWCDGPPHCYKPALDEAERLLQAIDDHMAGHRN
jgi:hypothetical protein